MSSSLDKKKKKKKKGEKEGTKKITETKKVSLLRRFQDHETKGLITNQIRSQPNPLQPPNPEPNFSRREGKGREGKGRAVAAEKPSSPKCNAC